MGLQRPAAESSMAFVAISADIITQYVVSTRKVTSHLAQRIAKRIDLQYCQQWSLLNVLIVCRIFSLFFQFFIAVYSYHVQ